MSPPLGLGKKCPARVAYKVDQPPKKLLPNHQLFVPWLKWVPGFCGVSVVLLNFAGSSSAFQADWILDDLLFLSFLLFSNLFFVFKILAHHFVFISMSPLSLSVFLSLLSHSASI